MKYLRTKEKRGMQRPIMPRRAILCIASLPREAQSAPGIYRVQVMAVHGVAGYLSRCRCLRCASKQQNRRRRLTSLERGRVNTAAAPTANNQPPRNRGHRWSDNDYVVAADMSLTLQQVAALTGRSEAAVRAARGRLRRGEVPSTGRSQRGRRWSDVDRAIALDPTLSVPQAAARLGRTVIAIQQARRLDRARQRQGRISRRQPPL
ncbi:Uncharacterised protein [Mycobacteroides abscessus subsp. massiliense]|nr:Uncharacterised protein [Mycobacteroides abscessus subsp. massiliense]SKR36444.1 Uncharacterised protein [Mycobacteroides abscessus subsp. massiliense]SKT84977.1 Uncharacterised protein [Mycobacteroides abscessus subsp. massiliense]SKU14046.1 Uncharacterised protein [Mycobacteroides abscessus subsp. massiliense]SLA37302.1 Uncharacterised protein [Mycobacteroides abscessus subsp. massiliense]